MERRRTARRGNGLGIEAAPDPAGPGVIDRVEPGRMPDGHAAEVGTVGIWVADTRHDGEAPGLENPASTLHRGMKANPLGDGDEPIDRQRSAWRFRAYPSSLNGTTVLIPSLPPSS